MKRIVLVLKSLGMFSTAITLLCCFILGIGPFVEMVDANLVDTSWFWQFAPLLVCITFMGWFYYFAAKGVGYLVDASFGGCLVKKEVKNVRNETEV